MAHRSWLLYLEGAKQVVELDHSYWSGKRTIRVNGEVVHQSSQLLDNGSNHPFRVGDHAAVVRITTNGFTFHYDLVVDGTSVSTGQHVASEAGTFYPFGIKALGSARGTFERDLLSAAFISGLAGLQQLMMPTPLSKVIGVLLLGICVSAWVIRRRVMFLVIMAGLFSSGVPLLLGSGRGWWITISVNLFFGIWCAFRHRAFSDHA